MMPLTCLTFAPAMLLTWYFIQAVMDAIDELNRPRDRDAAAINAAALGMSVVCLITLVIKINQ